jgi:hypothetical protein
MAQARGALRAILPRARAAGNCHLDKFVHRVRTSLDFILTPHCPETRRSGFMRLLESSTAIGHRVSLKWTVPVSEIPELPMICSPDLVVSLG